MFSFVSIKKILKGHMAEFNHKNKTKLNDLMVCSVAFSV
jgi:hypothetical protein